MTTNFHHGVRIVEIDTGSRPIRSVTSGVIGLVGTAPLADEKAFPLNKPVLIAGNLRAAAKLGRGGTLPQALTAIFDQIGAIVVVVRVAKDDEDAVTKSNIIGSVDEETGTYTGIMALLSAESQIAIQPRILIAPGFSNDKAVADKLIAVADRLRAYTLLDGPNTNDAEAIKYREKFGSRRAEVLDPWFEVWDNESNSRITEAPSARHAGVMSKVHNNLGFWHSNSNQIINGVLGLSRPVDFKIDDSNCRANLLNAKNVTTVIQSQGYRVWGNRTCSADAKWQFKSIVITNDLIADSIVRAHLWAVDRNITTTYIADVTKGINDYLANLKRLQAIAGGRCWADPELNTPDVLQQGQLFLDYDFMGFSPAENIQVRSRLENGYLKEVF